MHVSPESLAAAAARADAESQSVFARHSAADVAVAAARYGWVGASAMALAEAAQRWEATTADLAGRIYRHGEALRVSGLTYAEMAARHAQALSGPGPS